MTDRNRSNESGQSILVIAFIVLVLLALVALVVDVGNAYAQRRIVQNAVDAAAMAGALKLSENDPGGSNLVSELAVWQVINDYAMANGLAGDGWDAWFIDSTGAHSPDTVDQFVLPVPSWADGVQVQGDLAFDTYFAHLIGFEQMAVSAEAPAYILFGPCSGDELFPMAVNVANFEDEDDGEPVEGVNYPLWEKMNGVSDEVDGWWWVNWLSTDPDRGFCSPVSEGPDKCQGPSSQTLTENMLYPERSGTWRAGNWAQQASGTMQNPQQCALGARIMNTYFNDTSVPGCKANNPAILLSNEVTIPLFDAHSSACPADEDPDTCGMPGNVDAYRLAGFGRFQLLCYMDNNVTIEGEPGACDVCVDETGDKGKCISGKFVGWADDAFEDGCIDTGITAPSFRHPSQP